MKKLVEKLGVKRAEKRDIHMIEHLNDKVMRLTVSGVESVIGVHGHGFWRNMVQVRRFFESFRFSFKLSIILFIRLMISIPGNNFYLGKSENVNF